MTDALRMEIVDDRQWTALLQRIAGNLNPAVGAALYGGANLVMTAAKLITPVGQYPPKSGRVGGTLRNSGMVDDPVIAGDQITVVLGFGGAAAAYAIPQHEDLSYRHPVGQAKFLEVPMLAAAGAFESDLAAALVGKL